MTHYKCPSCGGTLLKTKTVIQCKHCGRVAALSAKNPNGTVSICMTLQTWTSVRESRKQGTLVMITQ